MDEVEADANRRLEELEDQLAELRQTLEGKGNLDEPLKREWDDMMSKHADIRRRLRAGEMKGSPAVAMLNQDIDILRHAFFHWAARVDERFSTPAKK